MDYHQQPGRDFWERDGDGEIYKVQNQPHESKLEKWTTCQARYKITCIIYCWKHLLRYLLGDGESNDGVPLKDLPCDHGRVDFNLPDGHIEWSWQHGIWLRQRRQEADYEHQTSDRIQETRRDVLSSCTLLLLISSKLRLIVHTRLSRLDFSAAFFALVLYIFPSLLSPTHISQECNWRGCSSSSTHPKWKS